jgi:3D (Asp-Asp-Asp) domain-containing protein
MAWNEAMVVAVDPDVIPLGTKILVVFQDEAHKKYNGVYTAKDTGGAIKGHKLDFYMGDTVAQQAMLNFGVAKAKVYILKDAK